MRKFAKQLVVMSFVLSFAVSDLLPSRSGAGGEWAQGQTPEEAAQNLYNTTALVLEEVQDDNFDAAFPAFTLYRVFEETRLPPIVHMMAWHPVLETGYDLTIEYNTILTLSGAAITSAATALKYAKPFATFGNSELEDDRPMVNSSHSTALNVTVYDPEAVQVGLEWRANITTWSDRNGVLANWTLLFAATSLKNATWNITHTSVGSFYFDLHGTSFRVNVSVQNAYQSTSYNLTAYQMNGTTGTKLYLWNETNPNPLTTVANSTNYDNSTWVVNFNAPSLPVEGSIVDFGRAMAEAGRSSYENQTRRNKDPNSPCYNRWNPSTNWTFESEDNDCQLNITIFKSGLVPEISATPGENGNEVRIRVSLAIKEFMNAMGFYTNLSVHDLGSIGKSIIDHEHFHVLQSGYGTSRWDLITEGQARFSPTAHVPEVESDESSLWYAGGGTGANGYPNYPWESFCTRESEKSSFSARTGYMFSLYWGYLYAQDGGIPTIKKFLELYDTGCPPTKITQTLQARANETTVQHTNFSSSLIDFSVALYTRNFSWSAANGGSSYNFGQYLDDAVRDTQPMNQTKQHPVGGWAINYTELPTNVNFTVNQTLGNASHWNTRILLTHSNGTLELRDFGPTEVIALSGANYSKITYCAVHVYGVGGLPADWESANLTLTWAS